MALETTGIFDAVMAADGQANMARSLGVTPQAVNIWVSKGYAPMRRIVEIEALYGVSRNRLINPKYLSLVAPVRFETIEES